MVYYSLQIFNMWHVTNRKSQKKYRIFKTTKNRDKFDWNLTENTELHGVQGIFYVFKWVVSYHDEVTCVFSVNYS